MNFLLPALTLTQREIVRFCRQRSRLMAALLTPIIFWLVLGSGLGSGYREYFFPGALTMTLLFTAIYSTISIIEDRKEGFLQAVLVAPVSPASIVLGKILGAAILATGQAMVFLMVAPLIGIPLGAAKIVLAGVVFLEVAFGLSALGFLLAWRMESVQGFHAIMNLLLLPMWLLSGAAFSPQTSSAWMRGLMLVNPLTYGVSAIRWVVYRGTQTDLSALPSVWKSFGICGAMGALFFVWALVEVHRRRTAR